MSFLSLTDSVKSTICCSKLRSFHEINLAKTTFNFRNIYLKNFLKAVPINVEFDD